MTTTPHLRPEERQMSCDHEGCTCTPPPASISGELPQAPQGGDAGPGGCCGGHGHPNGEPATAR